MFECCITHVHSPTHDCSVNARDNLAVRAAKLVRHHLQRNNDGDRSEHAYATAHGRPGAQKEEVWSSPLSLCTVPEAVLARSSSPEVSDEPPHNRRRSVSPPVRAHLIEVPRVSDVDPVRRAEREKALAARVATLELEKMEKKDGDKGKEPDLDARAEFAKLTNSRSGGVYMPPARLRALQAAAAKDKTSAEYQRLSWDALRKSITGIVNRVNVQNIKMVVPELFSENLIRGRGLFARSVMKAQSASLPFTPVFAALVAIINTKLPQVGELLVTRLISQFRRSFKRNDKVRVHI